MSDHRFNTGLPWYRAPGWHGPRHPFSARYSSEPRLSYRDDFPVPLAKPGYLLPIAGKDIPISSATRYRDPIFPSYTHYANNYWHRVNGQLGANIYAGWPIDRPAY